jgi:hypothetical protein
LDENRRSIDPIFVTLDENVRDVMLDVPKKTMLDWPVAKMLPGYPSELPSSQLLGLSKLLSWGVADQV